MTRNISYGNVTKTLLNTTHKKTKRSAFSQHVITSTMHKLNDLFPANHFDLVCIFIDSSVKIIDLKKNLCSLH